jgi:hypothetical protein
MDDMDIILLLLFVNEYIYHRLKHMSNSTIWDNFDLQEIHMEIVQATAAFVAVFILRGTVSKRQIHEIKRRSHATHRTT